MYKTITLFKLIFIFVLLKLPYAGTSGALSYRSFFAGDTTKQNKEKKNSFVALPVAFYTPETTLAFGGVMINLFKLDPNDTLTRTSNVRTALIYTLRNQIILSSDYNVFLKEEKFQIRGNFSFLTFPDNFYGIGNDTELDNIEVYDNNIFNFTFRLMRNVGNGFFVGGMYNFYSMFNIQPEEGRMLENGSIEGSEGVALSGIGLIATYDKRDNVLNATRGHYLEFSSRFYAKAFGSSHGFQFWEFDLRKYFSLKKRHVFAIQGKVELSSGDVPFQKLALLGGDKLLRGYYRGRYRDKNLYVVQGEYRYKISNRFGFVIFGGLGDVGPQLSTFKINESKASYGGGLRVALNRKERINVRIDYGFGFGVSNFYINLAEAF